MIPSSIDQITAYVEKILSIEDITTGDPQKDFMVRYRGKLRLDSVEAYESLDISLQQLNLTPLFRQQDNKDVVFIQAGRVQSKPSNPWINLIMFLITFISVVYTGALAVYQPPEGIGTLQYLLGGFTHFAEGLPFGLSLMAILLAHELGHYFVGRYRHAPVTLPYFIPLPAPISPFGTMGAVIQMKAPPRNKRSLLEIGIAGPLAGFIVAIPILIYGLTLSKIEPITLAPGNYLQMEGNSIFYLFMKWAIFGKLLPEPSSFGNLSPIFYWIIYFFTGRPFPWGAFDVIIHPIAFAGWAGLLVTALNLLPVGQLDGGHILYALLGSKAKKLFPFLLGATILLGFIWQGWWLWAALLFVFGRMYDEPLDQITTLDKKRKILAVVGLFLFIILFIPVPLIIVTAPVP
jgi:hypothetical protein